MSDYKEKDPNYDFGYQAGQLVYYLFYQSEAEGKTHGMLEPFRDIRDVKTLFKKLEELFQNYKHKIWLGNREFNSMFAKVAEYVASNENQLFDNKIKAGFYAGYFDDNKLFSKNTEKGDKDEY
ncbi:MAG: CRISPR-associated protein Csh1 [Desulfonauticus sp.]|nr:CRISPR-associated protein Csh1 [Desulfonauticus sp.]